MSALAEALVAAQARAVAALGKQYVGGAIDDVTVRADLASIGLTDDVDTARLLAAWDILRSAGAPAPSEQTVTEKPSDKATDAQLTLIAAELIEQRRWDAAQADKTARSEAFRKANSEVPE